MIIVAGIFVIAGVLVGAWFIRRRAKEIERLEREQANRREAFERNMKLLELQQQQRAQ